MENRGVLGTGYNRKREFLDQGALGAGVRQEHGCNRTRVHWMYQDQGTVGTGDAISTLSLPELRMVALFLLGDCIL